MGLSVRNSLPFFEKYSLGLEVINVFGEILFEHRPKKLSANINPQVFRMLIHNNHPYRLDGNLSNQFAQLKKKHMMSWEQNDLVVSNKYQIRKKSSLKLRDWRPPRTPSVDGWTGIA